MVRYVQISVSHPDAIHLGTALAYEAEAFITNDARLKSLTEINVLVLADFA
jgi:hypothetical protein